MADLQQLIGAILRDLAKARFASDLYSRSIARYYENDLLLRRYPIPRTEIEEAELQLKFAIAQVSDNPVNAETREANVAFLLERTVEELVAIFLDCTRDFIEAPAQQAIRTDLETKLSKGFNSIAMRIELRQLVLRYFIDSYTHLIDAQGTFDHAMALRDLRRPFFWGITNYRKENVALHELNDSLNRLFDHVFPRQEFVEVLEALVQPVRGIWQENHDARLDVEVGADKLAHFGEGTLSTLKLKLSVRNQMWTEVKIDEHRSSHILTSE